MGFKFPEQYRLTDKKAKSHEHISKQILEITTDTTHTEDGFFAIPAMGKKDGMFYMVRATVVQGYRMVAINIPTQGRCATWEEQNYIKNMFWDVEVPVIMVHPGNYVYVGNNKYWVHLWEPAGLSQKDYLRLLPPIYEASYPFRIAGFWTQLYRTIKRKLKRS